MAEDTAPVPEPLALVAGTAQAFSAAGEEAAKQVLKPLPEDAKKPKGVRMLNSLRDAGYSNEEIATFKHDLTQKLADNGATKDRIEAFWGEQNTVAAVEKMGKDKLRQTGWSYESLDEANPNSWLDNLWAGLEVGNVNLALGTRPTMRPSDNPSFGSAVAFAVGQTLADLPIAIPAFVGGTTVAAETGPLAPAFGMAAASGATTFVRESALLQFSKREDASTREMAEAWGGVLKKTAVSSGIGFVGGVVLGPAANQLQRVGANRAVSYLGADIVSGGVQSTVAAALEQRLPTMKDFAVGTLLAGVSHVGAIGSMVGRSGRFVPTEFGAKVMNNMKEIWGQTGVHPADIGNAARNNPYLKQSIVSTNQHGDPIIQPWKDPAAVEGDPVKAAEMPVKAAEMPVKADAPEEPEPFQFRESAKASPETGIFRVTAASPNQVLALLDRSDPDYVSPSGSIGVFQITPGLARKHGFDPAKLTDPEYNRTVAATLAEKYVKTFTDEDGTVDLEAVLISMSDSPERAMRFRADGRVFDNLSNETQDMILRSADRLDDNTVMEPPRGPPRGPPGEPPKGPPGEPPAADMTPDQVDAAIRKTFALPEKEKANVRDIVRNGFTQLSEYNPARRFDRAVKPTEEFSLTDIAQLRGSVRERAASRIFLGGMKLVTDDKGRVAHVFDGSPALTAALAEAVKIDKGSYGGFVLHMQARDTLDRAKLGKVTTLDPAIATRKLEQDGSKYDAAVAKWRDAVDNRIDEYVASGLISKGRADAWRESHPNWFPQYTDDQKITGRGLFKRAKGQENRVKMPVLSAMELTRRGEHAVAVNRERAYTVAMMLKYLDGEDVVPRYGHDMDLEVFAQSRKDGPLRVIDRSDEAFDPVTGWPEPKETFTEKDGDLVIRFREKGKLLEYRPKDTFISREIVEMLHGISDFDPGLANAFVQRTARGVRTLTVETPAFVIKSMLRDGATASLVNKYGGVPYLNVIPNVLTVFGQVRKRIKAVKAGGLDPDNPNDAIVKKFQEFGVNGGMGAALVDMARSSSFDDMVALDRIGHFDAMTNSVRNPLVLAAKKFRSTAATAREIMRAGDALTRYTVAKKAAPELGITKSALEGRKVSGDFAEKAGNRMLQFLMTWTPFFPSSVRGAQSVIRNIAKNPGRLAYLGGSWAMANIAVRMYNEWYEEANGVPEQDRISSMGPNAYDNKLPIWFGGVKYNIPTPFVVQPWLGGLPNRFLDWYKKDDPQAFKGFQTSVLQAILPPGIGPVLASPYVKVPVELVTGTDPQTGIPIVPPSMDGAFGYTQYQPWTSELAKNISYSLGPQGIGLTDFSPLYVDKLVNDFSGTIGTNIIHLFDPALGSGRAPGDSDFKLFETSFIARNPGKNAAPVREFYDLAREVNKFKESIRLMKDRGEFEEVAKLEQDPRAGLKLNKILKALTKTRKIIERTTYDKTMSASDKRQIFDNMYAIRIQIAKSGVKLIREAMAQANQTPETPETPEHGPTDPGTPGGLTGEN
jgi:hypothetical protein